MISMQEKIRLVEDAIAQVRNKERIREQQAFLREVIQPTIDLHEKLKDKVKALEKLRHDMYGAAMD